MQTLITKHYAGLFNGMSQQAPTLRLETQGDYQENAVSSIVYGLCQRPPVELVKEMDDVGYPFWHTINRDEKERYIISLSPNGELRVMNLVGFTYPIEGLASHQNYITTKNPRTDIAMTTIGDYTFIVNKRKVIKMKKTYDSFKATSDFEVKIENKSEGYTDETRAYFIKVDGTTLATYTHVKSAKTPKDKLESEEDILKILRDQINARTGFSATEITKEGEVFTFKFRRADGTRFTTEVDDRLNYSTLGGNVVNDIEYDKKAIIYVSKGVAEQNYRVKLSSKDGSIRTEVSYATGNTSQGSTYRTEVIASNLASQINSQSSGNFETKLYGAVIEVWAKDKKDFDIEVGDSWGDAALKAFKGRAQAFTALPPKAPEGTVLQIVGKTDSDEGTYWVRFENSYLKDGERVSTTGVWKEYREPNGFHRFDNATMPLQLIRKQDIARYKTADNPLGLYFALEYCLWSDRAVGDENSNPNPSFVDNTINDIFLFSNRLGILSGQSVSLTKVGDFFNFFASTVTDALDDAPIDIDVPSTSVTTLYYAKASRDNLMIFGDDQQFILNSGNDPLSSKTINAAPILSYPFDSSVRPISLGQMTYFVSPKGWRDMCVREYFIQSDGMINDAPSITDHVPKLLTSPKEGRQIAGMANEDILFVCNDTNKLYVYKYSWSGDKKTQSSWSVWTFCRDVKGIFCFDDKLYLFFEGGVFGLIDLSRVGGDFECIDFLKSVTPNTASLVEPNNKDYIIRNQATKETYTFEQFKAGAIPQAQMGYKYHFKYHFSPIFLKFTNDVVGSIDGRTLLRRATIYLSSGADIDVSIRDYGLDKERLKYTWVIPAEAVPPKVFKRTFILRGEAKENKLCIESADIRPIYIQSVSFEILTSLIDKPL